MNGSLELERIKRSQSQTCCNRFDALRRAKFILKGLVIKILQEELHNFYLAIWVYVSLLKLELRINCDIIVFQRRVILFGCGASFAVTLKLQFLTIRETNYDRRRGQR